jgi:hypothetical protein
VDRKNRLEKRKWKRFIKDLFRERRKVKSHASITVLISTDHLTPIVITDTTVPAGTWIYGWNFYGKTIDGAYAKAYDRLKDWYFLPDDLALFGILYKGTPDLNLEGKNAGLGGLALYKLLFKSDAKSFAFTSAENRRVLQNAVNKLHKAGAIIRSPFTGCFFTITKYRNVMTEQGFGMLVRNYSYTEEDGYVYR